MADTIKYRFRLRRRTAANWTALNEVLLNAEIGYESDTDKMKIGDGTSPWNALDYFASGVISLVEGPNIDIDSSDPEHPIVSSTLGAVLLKGRVETYGDLPSSGNTSGDAYVNDVDGLIYVWNGTDWPADGNGLRFSGGAGPGDLAREIMKDTPLGYWKCDESSGSTLADSSGNGFHATVLGSPVLGSWPLLPADPSYRGMEITSLQSGGKVTGTLGLIMPYTGSYTIEAVVQVYNASSSGTIFFSFYLAGETPASNAQAYFNTFASNVLNLWWEHNSGANEQFAGGASLFDNKPHHVAASKDTPNKRVKLFVDGRKIAQLSYVNEQTGGSSTDTYIGSPDTVNSTGYALGHVAFFDSLLTDERIQAHARAAGFI